MLADCFTKPLQGSLFRQFRDVLLGYQHVDSLALPDPAPSVEERVGENRADNSGTEDPSADVEDSRDGFITVVSKRPRYTMAINHVSTFEQTNTIDTRRREVDQTSSLLTGLFRENDSRNQLTVHGAYRVYYVCSQR
jgi:hypothetical protein